MEKSDLSRVLDLIDELRHAKADVEHWRSQLVDANRRAQQQSEIATNRAEEIAMLRREVEKAHEQVLEEGATAEAALAELEVTKVKLAAFLAERATDLTGRDDPAKELESLRAVEHELWQDTAHPPSRPSRFERAVALVAAGDNMAAWLSLHKTAEDWAVQWKVMRGLDPETWVLR